MTIHELYPYLHVRDAPRAIAFYCAAFGAIESMRLDDPSGRIGHAELRFGDTTLMLADEFPEFAIVGPATVGGTTCTLHLHVGDADAMIERAVAAGAQLVMEPTDHFYGERSGVVLDPFGHRWTIGHSIEDVSRDEMQRRYSETSCDPPGDGG